MTNEKTDQAKPVELTRDAADEVRGGALEIVFSDILVSSVKDSRPKGSTKNVQGNADDGIQVMLN